MCSKEYKKEVYAIYIFIEVFGLVNFMPILDMYINDIKVYQEFFYNKMFVLSKDKLNNMSNTINIMYTKVKELMLLLQH